MRGEEMQDYALKKALDVLKRYQDAGHPLPYQLVYSVLGLLKTRQISERVEFFEDLIDEYSTLIPIFALPNSTAPQDEAESEVPDPQLPRLSAPGSPGPVGLEYQ